jgi:uncharacterized membrane protein
MGPGRRRELHRLFEAGVLLKGIDGILETAGGVLLQFMSLKALNAVLLFLTAHELSEDPGDLVARALYRAVHELSPETKSFAAAYLVAHGVVKVFLAVLLLRGKLWAYPTALWFLGAFTLYQIYRFALTYSPGQLALTILDLVVMLLIWLEYRARRGGG